MVPVAQPVTCLATDASLTADPGVGSFSFLQLNHSRRVVVSYKQKYVHEVLVTLLVQASPGKSVVR